MRIGSGIFKLRLRRKGSGKSGGYRLYVFVMEVKGILTPVSIYAKSDRENLTKGEVAEHVEMVRDEMIEWLNT